LQYRTANIAVGPSTVRGNPSGTATRARKFLADMDIAQFCPPNERRFRNVLDRETASLMRALPSGGQHWGLARKLLNIFLRDALYNKYLSHKYKLTTIELWLEIPLDSHVGSLLRLESRPTNLPAWTTIKALAPDMSAKFQSAAQAIANERGIARVHLDLFFWRGDD